MTTPSISLAEAVDTARAGTPTAPEAVAALLAGYEAQHAAIARVRELSAKAADKDTWTVQVSELDSVLAAANVGGV